MTLIRRVDAMHWLMKLVAQDEISWDSVSDMVRQITDRNLEKNFDNYINHEFPNGVDNDEFVNFCLNSQKDIYEELGLKPKNIS